MYQSPVYEKYLQKQDKKSKSTNLYNVLADEQSIVPQDNTVSRDGFFDLFRHKKNDENNIPEVDEVNEVVSINDDNNENNNVIEFDDEPELEVYPSEESSSEIVSSDTPFQDMNYRQSTEDNDLQDLLDELNNENSEDFETTTDTTQNNYQSRPVLKSGTSRYIENLRKYYD